MDLTYFPSPVLPWYIELFTQKHTNTHTFHLFSPKLNYALPIEWARKRYLCVTRKWEHRVPAVATVTFHESTYEIK